jgi:hypothetical protein
MWASGGVSITRLRLEGACDQITRAKMHQSELVAPVRSKTTHSGQQQHGQAGPRHGVAGLRSLSHSLSDANLA